MFMVLVTNTLHIQPAVKHLSVVNLSLQIFSSYPCIRVDIHLFESSDKIFHHLSHPNNAVYSSETFISSMSSLHLSRRTSRVPHKLLASLFRLDAVNLQLSINYFYVIFITHPCQLDVNCNIKTDVFLLVLCKDPNIVFIKPLS